MCQLEYEAGVLAGKIFLDRKTPNGNIMCQLEYEAGVLAGKKKSFFFFWIYRKTPNGNICPIRCAQPKENAYPIINLSSATSYYTIMKPKQKMKSIICDDELLCDPGKSG